MLIEQIKMSMLTNSCNWLITRSVRTTQHLLKLNKPLLVQETERRSHHHQLTRLKACSYITSQTTQAVKSTYLQHVGEIVSFKNTARFLSDKELQETPTKLTEAEYEDLAEETLDSLCDFFDELGETTACNDEYDCAFGNGVLTLNIGGTGGTYVINKQTPNRQIWLSSPTSGPKRFDYYSGRWLYSRDGSGLHQLLEEELSDLMDVQINLNTCKFYSK